MNRVSIILLHIIHIISIGKTYHVMIIKIHHKILILERTRMELEPL